VRQRTGIAEIDAVIERFLASTVKCRRDWRTRDPISVQSLAFDPAREPGYQLSTGWCGSTAAAFHQLAVSSGLKAAHTDDDITGWVNMVGYHDMPYGPLDEDGQPPHPRVSEIHVVNIVFWGEHAYLIDFTASQYGYEALPLVRRTSAELGHELTVMGNDIGQDAWEHDWQDEAQQVA
jgi:hypothetical protein